MKRRRFLQLAASAAAGVAVSQPGALAEFLSYSAFRLAPISLAPEMQSRGTLISLHKDPSLLGSAPAAAANAASDTRIEMLWEKSTAIADNPYQWVIQGKLYTAGEPVRLLPGQRYSLRMMNATAQTHQIHLLHEGFEVVRMDQVAVTGMFRNTVRLGGYAVVDADVVIGRTFGPA